MDVKRVVPLARRQFGNVTRQQLLAAGYGRGAIRRAVERGWLHPRHAGVYSFTPSPTRYGRWMAATLATGAPLSHVSAAALHGLLADRRIDVEVTTTGRARGQPGIIVHRTTLLPATDVMQRDGIPVTTPTRTVLDLLQTVEQHLALAAAMNALHHGTLDEQRILTADWRGRKGGPSVAALRRRLVDRTRTELEAAMLELCARAELPRPTCQHRIGRSTVDFAWPDHRTVVETDGWATHRTRAAFETDRGRDAHLATRGWTVLRFTHRQLHERPELVLRALRTRLAAV